MRPFAATCSLGLLGERQPGDPILIAEGYATAASIHEATSRSVVCAFDSNNLGPVAEVLRERAPDAPILICGDNDHHLGAADQNVGLNKAQEAALAVGGKAVVPNFTAEEREEGKAFTDFNDLHRSRGLEAVKRQVEAPLLKLTQEMGQAREQQQEQAQEKEIERKAPEKTLGLSR